MEESDKRISYPCFFSSEQGTFSELLEIPSKIDSKRFGHDDEDVFTLSTIELWGRFKHVEE